MIFLLNYLVLAWTEPDQSPPAGNVSAPLNVGNTGQSKSGGLVLNTGNATTGLIVAYGNVAIGKTNPSYKLDVNGMVGVNNNRITGVATPVDSMDAVNKEYVDALGSAGVNMPLQGQSTIYSSDTHVISTIPISLPAANCQVKITVCGSTPPSQLIIGADPVPRTTKSEINLGPAASVTYSLSCTGSCNDATCPSGWYARVWQTYPSGDGYYYCCPNGTTLAESTKGNKYCFPCTSQYPYIDTKEGHTYCYNTPRCSAASSGQVLTGYNDSENLCVYCPSDHPQYDMVSKNCIKSASVSTIKIGANCSTLSTVLSYAFTDVTFADASSNPLTTAYYVGFAYSCSQ